MPLSVRGRGPSSDSSRPLVGCVLKQVQFVTEVVGLANPGRILVSAFCKIARFRRDFLLPLTLYWQLTAIAG